MSLEIFQAVKTTIFNLGMYSSIFILSGCYGSKQKLDNEVIVVPIIPAEFSEVSKPIYTTNFNKLPTETSLVNSNPIGRQNPFLAPALNSSANDLPKSFRFEGILMVNGEVRAFVSKADKYGSILEGNIGGKDTVLIPDGWIVQMINIDSQELVLSKKDQLIKLVLYD